MAKKEFTKEQKAEYYAQLRAEWRRAKELAEQDVYAGVLAELQRMGLADISKQNVSLIMMQAEELGLGGLPYVDFKTYNHWRDAGFQVIKGERACVYTVTWVPTKASKAKIAAGEMKEDEINLRPSKTSLFHRSQVEEMEG